MNWRDLCERWISEALEEAIAKDKSKYVIHGLEKALESMRSTAPAEVEDPLELYKLPRIGAKTIAMLTAKTQKYCSEHPEVPLPISLDDEKRKTSERQPIRLGSTALGENGDIGDVVNSRKPTREYVPRHGSPAYHCLICLRRTEKEGLTMDGLGKSELSRLVRPRLAESNDGRIAPNLGVILATLHRNGLVYLHNSRYQLDERGRRMADRFLSIEAEKKGALFFKPGAQWPAVQPAMPRPSVQPNTWFEMVWAPGDYRIQLLLDNREIADKHNRMGFVEDLEKAGVRVNQQALSVSDALWVAEHLSTGRRAVLDWAIERKTLQDLKMSIHDGRYAEQKMRLAKSTLQHVVYLVEYEQTASNRALFKEQNQKFRTAMSQTLILHGFELKITSGQLDTVRYLANMTRMLESEYALHHLHVMVPHVETFEKSMTLARQSVGEPAKVGIDYDSFHEGMSKSKLRTVGEIFRTMLTTIKGITPEKAMVIQQLYPTPMHLYDAYQALAASERPMMISAATQDQITRRKIRPDISELIYHVWGQ